MAGTVEQARNRFLKQVVVSSAVGCAPPDTKNPVLRVILQSNKIMLTNCLNGARDVFRRGDPRRLGRGLRGQFSFICSPGSDSSASIYSMLRFMHDRTSVPGKNFCPECPFEHIAEH